MSDRRIVNLIPSETLAAAVTSKTFPIWQFDPGSVRSLTVLADFVRAAGGTTTDVLVETSFDNGSTWVEIMQFAFLVTTDRKLSSVRRDIAVAGGIDPDGALADDAILDGVIGDRIRAVLTTTGTYSGASSITLTCIPA